MSEMIIDDALMVICYYATPGVSLDLLTSFLPKDTYQENVWRLKTMAESRGLVVDDSVVNLIRGGVGSKWYAYYLVKNRTYCGDLLVINGLTKYRPKITNKLSDVIYYEVVRLKEHRKVTIVQYRDLSVKIRNKTYRNVFQKIRQTVPIKALVNANEEATMLVILDEFGEVWSYRIDNGELQKLVEGKGIVAVVVSSEAVSMGLADQPLLMLNRDGQVRYSNKQEHLVSPKLVSIDTSGFFYEDYAINSSGHRIIVTAYPYEWWSTDVDRSMAHGEVRISDRITTKLKPTIYTNYYEGLEIVSYARKLAITIDRTAYAGVDARVPLSDHRAQMVTLDIHDHTGYVIVDADTQS